ALRPSPYLLIGERMSQSVFGRAAPRRPSLGRSALGALAALSLLSFAACEADTLYDGDVITGPSTSLTPHTVAIEADLPERVELTDSIHATVGWRDPRET